MRDTLLVENLYKRNSGHEERDIDIREPAFEQPPVVRKG